MAGEWRERTLGELTENFDGIRVPVKEADRRSGPYPYYGASGIVDHVDGFLFDGEYLLVAEDGENLRTRTTPIAFLAREKFWVNNHAHVVRGNHEADTRFLMYSLAAADISGYLTGSTMPKLTQGNMNRIPLLAPPLPEQRAIAHILGTLDDKIELNRRMSETLEAMARALFKSWFVDFNPVRAKLEGRDPGLPKSLADLFPAHLVDSELGEIPEGWEVGSLGDFFAVGLGGAWGEDEQSNRATVAMRCLRGIDCHDLAEGRIPDVPVRWVSPKQSIDRELTEGTILIEGSGSFCGRSMIWRHAYGALLGKPVGYSNFCKRLDPRCTAAQATICWMQVRQAYRDGLLQSFRTGTAFPNFDVHGALSNLQVVMPPVPLAEAFGEIFALSQRSDLMAQSRTLAALRDTLLPKLISGDLRVKDAEKFIETSA
ncbi:MAG: restriction endonuclease subunit S [Steroidobacteraceae bacterium]